MQYQRHLKHTRKAMEEHGIDLMYLNYGPHMEYITGISTPMYYDNFKSPGDWVTGVLFGLDRDPVLVFQKDFFVEYDEETIWIKDARVLPDDKDPNEFIAEIFAEFKPEGKTIGFNKMLWGQTLLSLQAAAPGAKFVPAGDEMMDRVRSIKDEGELELMARASEITDQVLEAVIRVMKPGMVERDIATEVVYQIRLHGGDDYSFYPGIICVGNGSEPKRSIMTRNTDMILDPGTTVAFDFGVKYRGYCSDYGRSVFIGEPRADALKAYESITRASRAAMEIMGDERATPAKICDFVSDMVAADGFGDYYRYMELGHAIGLDIHEWPEMIPVNKEPIKAGMCFTLEPKVWRPGEFYVRCEDVVVVGKDRATPLTKFHYDPTVVE
jgi:Xaa-Pro aminopeptidase